ncbi:hypothetical protein G5V57_24465 [Nordella sp. HKS 07]|uniref:nSTAND1 domain-containing NTPase n=1 Tax=Nordella sp. HKS 07 TaxID=2712222 RepID=UPI0013E20452|nr:hypothetical protein [Nordella sp. HKS 07]QIG50607.1 hypothetical protein G5V57_24465 [Nordella sp. HKS 07]
MVQRLAKSNIMVVLGGSGCGKSSLVRAGLIPRLSTSASVPGLTGRWYVVEFRPGLDPNSALVDGFRDSIIAPVARFAPADDLFLGRRALVKALDLDDALITQDSEEQLRVQAVAAIRKRLFGDARPDELRATPLIVKGVFKLACDVLDRLDIELSRGARAGPPNLLMLIDQFEEAFRSEVTPQGQDNLCELIKETFKQRPSSLFLALTLRSEELHRCAEAGLANIVTETAYLLGPLDDENARREIIIRPAQAVFGDWIWAHEAAPDSDTAPFDAKVVQLLMDESQRAMAGLTHKSDYLPLLQHALQHLWDAAMMRWQRELKEGKPVDRVIGVPDLAHIGDGVEPGFLVRCLNNYADRARDEAIDKAAQRFTGPDARDKAERVVRTAFCAMARRDDRGNWARRFVSPARVAELLDNDAADKAAVKDVLLTFKRSGYLNRTGSGKDKKFDVSHEALIRNWNTYNDWLREIGALQHSLREVSTNIENEETDDVGAARPRSLWGWAWDWIREKNESRARELIPDRFREDVGKVVGPAKSVSVGLAAALLADIEGRKSPGQQEASGQAAVAEAREREVLEQEMRRRIGKMAEPWATAASKRYFPRWMIMTGAVGLLTIALGGGGLYLAVKKNELTRSQDRLYFGAVASSGNLDTQRWLEASAYELDRVYNRMNGHRSAENWVKDTQPYNEMSLSVSSWERAARQITGAVVFRDPTDSNFETSKSDCRMYNPVLMHPAGSLYLGVTYVEYTKSWWARLGTASRAGAEPAPDARLYPLAREGDMVCLNKTIPLLMVWPAGKDQEPRFWMLGLTCERFTGKDCVAWLPEPRLLRVTYPKKYAKVRAEPPWRKLWREKSGEVAGATLWASMDVYDFISPVQDAPPRMGFALKFGDEWLIADTTPGVNDPYLLSTSPNVEHRCAAAIFPCEFEMSSSKVRIDKESRCAKNDPGNCNPYFTVQAVPSEGTGYLPIWEWPLPPDAPIDVVTTDGKVMDFHTADGMWRRRVIGVQTLAEHVKLLAGSMSDEQGKEKLDIFDLSEACRKTRCYEWAPLEDSAAQSWQW